MKKGLLFLLLTCYCLSGSFAQSFTDSNLPIVIIETDGGGDPGDAGVLGSMKVIYRGAGLRNHLTDQDSLQFLNYNGRISIKNRGSSTDILQKKQYKVSTIKADNVTDNNVALMGLPADNDWVYNAMGYDPALIRDYLCYNLTREIGEYASRTVYFELILNNQYRGLYLLQEKIKQGKDRVNITKMAATDNFSPNISGGYIVKADHAVDPIIFTMPSYIDQQDVLYYNEYPKPETVTQQQNAYIAGIFQQLAVTSHSHDASIETGYPSVIDMTSFVDYMIISELSSNADSYQYSTYFHKDRNGKLRAGPLWDSDLTFGNDLIFWGLDRSHSDVWQFGNGDNQGSKFWYDLFNSQEFRCLFYKKWMDLTKPGAPLNYTTLSNLIDGTVTAISEAADRNNSLWGMTDMQYKTDPTSDFPTSVAKIKSFINTRINWITSYLQSNTTGCPVRTMPPLVITRISYNPLPTLTVLNGKDLEFIEIANTGTETVNLTGDFFAGSGFVYQFPPLSRIKAGTSRILASNAYAFTLTYGFPPSDQFTRNLSNENAQLVLSDALGDTIDYVNYSSLPPWPDANGNGDYLQLIDPSLNNNNPASWIAISNKITSDVQPASEQDLLIYPNPAKNIVKIKMAGAMNTIQLYNIEGEMVKSVNPGSSEYDLDISSYSSGMYYIRVFSASEWLVRKLIIQ